MTGNDFMAWVLRSPFHALLSNNMMLISVTGRKTGKVYTTPVGFYEKDGVLWVMTSRNRTWWRNLRGGAQVNLLLKRSPVAALANAELDARSVEARMVEFLHHVPQAAPRLGIRVDAGIADAEDIARVSKDRLFVKIQPI